MQLNLLTIEKNDSTKTKSSDEKDIRRCFTIKKKRVRACQNFFCDYDSWTPPREIWIGGQCYPCPDNGPRHLIHERTKPQRNSIEDICHALERTLTTFTIF